MRTIGNYRILGLLGRGGMGAVYKVRHQDLGCVAALKLLAPAEMLEAVVGPAELERRFSIEARTMAGLRHDNIAPVWDFGRDADGRPFFVLDYCCNNVGAVIGETYRVEDATRVLRIDRAVDIARQALAGLGRLHFAGIVHRDVKPFNLLLTNTGRVLLIDFGLSKLRGERLDIHRAEQVGSPYYAAPEQEADPEAADARSDLFGVGVMLQRMLTGRLPQLSCDPPSRCNPDLDADWDAFLERATAADPGDRFADARAMTQALDALMSAWSERMADACALPDEPPAAPAAPGPGAAPRSAPMKTGPKAGPDAFGLDELWRPRAYAASDLSPTGAGCLTDAATGLTWQRGGSDYPLDYDEARDYVDGLNAASHCGRQDWRLPTVDELVTLLTPVAQGRDFCVEPLFDTRQDRLWSADRRTFTSAWGADAELGFVAANDMTCRLYVRAVSG